MADVNNINNQNNPSQWFQSLPIVTQYWFGATVVITLCGNFGVIEVRQFMWSWSMIKDRFELWRIITCFCYAGAFDFMTLVTVYMLYTMSIRYETGTPFNTGAGGGTADYAFALMFAMAMMLLTYPLLIATFPMAPFFTKNMVYFVMYVWSKRNPTAQANIWGIPMEAIWLPFAYLALTVFTGNKYFDLLHGLAIGHFYYFLVDVFPQVYGKDILVTPHFLIEQFGVGEYRRDRPIQDRAEARADARPAAGEANAGGHQWGGAGRALGRQ